MRLRYLSLLLFLVATAYPQNDSHRSVVAVVGDAKITEDELKLQPQILQLRKQEYELKSRAVENIILQKVLEQSAAARNLSAEEFLKQEVDSKIPEPSDAEVAGFYWGQRDKFREPLENIRGQVSQALRRAKIQEGRQALIERLRQQAPVRVLLEPPRVSVNAGNAPRRGSASAPVTIVEYSDYQCPYCKQAEKTLSDLIAKYGDRVSVVYKDFPLTNIHPQAQAAAEAARCAGEQGKYWEFHDTLFAVAPALAPDDLLDAAKRNQLDLEAFQACAAAHKYRSAIESSSLEGQQLGVNSTPSFFINGTPLTGAQPMSAFEKLIEPELASNSGR